MPRTVGPAVQVAPLGGAVAVIPARGGLDPSLTGGDGGPDRIQTPDGDILAPDHQAVAAFETPHPATGPAVDVVDPLGGQLLGTMEIVAVVRVAAVDHDVIGIEQFGQLVDGALHVPGRDHDPHGPRRPEGRHELLERRRPDSPLRLEFGDGGGIHVVDDAPMPVRHQAADEVRSHSPQTDHSELHRVLAGHVSTPVAAQPADPTPRPPCRVVSGDGGARCEGPCAGDPEIATRSSPSRHSGT